MQSRDVERTHKDLHAYLKEKDFTFANLSHFLAQYMMTFNFVKFSILTFQGIDLLAKNLSSKISNILSAPMLRANFGILMGKSTISFAKNLNTFVTEPLAGVMLFILMYQVV